MLAAFATNAAYAGQIQASSVSIAREVITTDTQAVIAPSVAYRFSGDVDARVQTQTFQVQFTLGSGAWAAAPTATAISVADGVSGALADQGAQGAGDYSVSNIGLSTDKKTLWATITVWNASATDGTALFTLVNTRLIKQPLISINVTSNNVAGTNPTNVAAQRGTVNGLFTVVGDLVVDAAAGTCSAVKTMPVTFKHYTALSNPAAIATDSTATPDEHVRAGSTNTATLITFPTNILPVITTSTGNAKINAAGANLNFSGTATGGAAPDSWINATVVNLGKISLSQNAQGYDANLQNNYLLTGNPANGGVSAVATATLTNGNVEASSLTATVTATNGFVSGGTLWLDSSAVCAGGGGIVSGGAAATAITAGTAAGPITLTVNTAQLNAALSGTGTRDLHVCYGVNGVATAIPQSAFTTKVVLVKAAAGANLNEQNNTCSGPHYSLGGGVKIDVRNYATSKANGGWLSVIRLINPNETRAVDVYGQIIHPDGTYGPWGLLTSGLNAGTANADKLAPRAVLNLTSTQVDAKLTNAPAHATTALNGSSTPVASDTGARLRITSNAASTLRVQNYLYNPDSKNFIEASSTQGVDFEGSIDRAPVNEGQYQDQDAQKGLNGK
ncbi:MAG: hypothetical protein HYS18_10295 [Burkholderiales bacterium]|nr:hypothetical protein [Burkholderiales bacterium]